MSDAHGRRVTPRVVARPEYLEDDGLVDNLAKSGQMKGRSTRNQQEKEAQRLLDRLVSHKRRIGGPGMHRVGATFINEERRRAIKFDLDVEELVDVADD